VLGAAAPERRPRVLHLVSSFEIGGTERQAAALLKRLDRDQYDVRLAVLRKSGPFYQEIASYFSEVPEFPLTSFYDANALKQWLRLGRLIRRERISVLHAHDFYSSFFGTVAARMSGIRSIASQRHLKLSDRRVHDWGGRFTHRLADRVVVNSEAVKKHLVASGAAQPAKIVVIKNGLVLTDDELRVSGLEGGAKIKRQRHDELCGALGLDRTSKLIGVVARLHPVKGHRVLLEAAAQIVRVKSKAYFLLVGDGPLRSEIEERLTRLGLSDRVLLLGDRTDVARLLLSFDLFVLPSLQEGLPNAVMEAMAAAVPVVATAVGGTTELIKDGETGFLAPPEQAAEITSRILLALSDEKASALMGWRGREHVMKDYSVERMVKSVEQVYRDLTQRWAYA
jgi:glycosyltransferase involved in cell wall biosynthesis